MKQDAFDPTAGPGRRFPASGEGSERGRARWEGRFSPRPLPRTLLPAQRERGRPPEGARVCSLELSVMMRRFRSAPCRMVAVGHLNCAQCDRERVNWTGFRRWLQYWAVGSKVLLSERGLGASSVGTSWELEKEFRCSGVTPDLDADSAFNSHRSGSHTATF